MNNVITYLKGKYILIVINRYGTKKYAKKTLNEIYEIGKEHGIKKYNFIADKKVIIYSDCTYCNDDGKIRDLKELKTNIKDIIIDAQNTFVRRYGIMQKRKGKKVLIKVKGYNLNVNPYDLYYYLYHKGIMYIINPKNKKGKKLKMYDYPKHKLLLPIQIGKIKILGDEE